MGVKLTCQKLAELRKSAASGSGTRLDGFVNAFKIVPGKGLQIGPQNEVGVTFPGFQLVLLGGADSSTETSAP